MTGFRHMPICNDTGKADCVEVQQLIILREESDFSISMFSNFIAACSSLPLLPVSSHLYLTTFFFPSTSSRLFPGLPSSFLLPQTVITCLYPEVLILLPLKRSHVAPIRWTI